MDKYNNSKYGSSGGSSSNKYGESSKQKKEKLGSYKDEYGCRSSRRQQARANEAYDPFLAQKQAYWSSPEYRRQCEINARVFDPPHPSPDEGYSSR